MSHRPFASIFPLFALALLASTGCASAPGEAPSSTSGEALSGIDADDIVGTIAYGQTLSTSYTSTPRYRAYRFAGVAGDRVSATVHSDDGSPRAWIVDGSFANLGCDDNGTGTAHDAHVSATLSTTGTFYIAFREAQFSNATFSVALSNDESCGPNCAPKCVRFEACVDGEDQITITDGTLSIHHVSWDTMGHHPGCQGVTSTVNPSLSLYNSNGVFAIDGVAYPLATLSNPGIHELVRIKSIKRRGSVTLSAPNMVDLNDVAPPGPALYVVDLCD